MVPLRDERLTVLREDRRGKYQAPQAGGVTRMGDQFLLASNKNPVLLSPPGASNPTICGIASRSGIPSWDGTHTVCFVNRAAGTIHTYDFSDSKRPIYLPERSFHLAGTTPGRAVFLNGRLLIPGSHAGIYQENP